MHAGRSHGQRHPRPIDAISGDLCIDKCKEVSVLSYYFRFIQRTGHAIVFVDDGKSASINLDIASVLEHRWIQRKITTIDSQGFCVSNSDVAFKLLYSCGGLRSLT